MLPYLYQLQDVRQIKRFGSRALLAGEMGVGKTVISLLHILRNPKQRPIIVVCPSTLKWNWQAEAARYINMRGEVLEGTKPPRGGFKRQHQLVIINYDILKYWIKYLKRLKPQLVIIDECHYLASRTSQRSKACQKLCQGVPHVLALSGTPVINRPSELWVTLNILRPKSFPAFHPFAFRFCGPKKNHWGWTFDGATRTKELNRRLLKEVMIRRTKQEVLSFLPPKQRVVLPFSVNLREYNHALTDFLGWLSNKSPEKVRTAAKAEALTKIGYLKQLAAKLKINQVFNWVDDFLRSSNTSKLILFAIHRDMIKKLHERYNDISVVVDGSVKGADRKLAIEKFLRDKKCRVFIGNIKAAGVGWSAKGVSTVAFVEMAWSPGAHSQAEDRAHGIARGDAKLSTSCYYLVARGTIEETLVKLIQKKQKVASQIIDGKLRKDDLDIFDRLIEAIRRRPNVGS